MTDVSRPPPRKSPDPSGPRAKLRARKPPGWRAKPPIPSPSEAVRSVMTGAMRLTGLVRETMVKVTHAASATTSVVTRTCCADNTKTESSHHTATFSTARQTESYQMAIPTDDNVEAGPHHQLSKMAVMAIPGDDSVKTGPQQGKAPLTKKCKALPFRKVAPVPQKSEQEPSSEAIPDESQDLQQGKAPLTKKCKAVPFRKGASVHKKSEQELSSESSQDEKQDSQAEQELGQTYSVAQLRKLFGETYSVEKPEQSSNFSDTYMVSPQAQDLGSTFVVRAENSEEVGALPYDSFDTVTADHIDDVDAKPFDTTFNKDRKLCLMAIPTEPHEEEEEEAGGLSPGATSAPQPPSLTDAMKSMVVKNIVREGYSLELVRHAVWRRLHAGGVLSGPELLQAVKDLEQEYAAAEKKLGDKDFLKEKEEVDLTLAMEDQVVLCVLSQGHDLETVRHVVWRRLQEGKGPFKSAPELLQAVTDLKREYEKAGKKLDDTEKTFDEKTVEYKDGVGKTVDASRAPLQRANSVVEAMASLVVDNVLRAGYDRDIVQHAVWRRLETHGENFASVAELLQALKDLEDEYARAKEKLGNDELQNMPPAVVTATTNTTTPESENTLSTEDTPPSPTVDNGTACTISKVTTDDNVESELERYREEHTCKVCFDARIEVVFVPCGHYACCGHCAEGMAECPMCRRGVDSTVKVFFS
ncbi:uncharacterized protein LOC144882757 isoform X2 [Branchiostoma floridae x Branchiostoma japonicum]